jgi:CIC family chloride channel protein
VAILEACLIGFVSGLAAVLIKLGASAIGSWRAERAAESLWWLPMIGMVGGIAAGWLIERFSPESSGSGTTQVRAALARMPIRLNLKVAFIKLTSTMLVLGSGMVLGRQGPTVHVGAALAAQLSRWVPTSPDYRRQMIAAGAAAGLAAGFNAPIAGVLFVVEELLQDVSGLTLGTAILASFIGAVVSRLLGSQGLHFFSTIDVAQAQLTVQELPLIVLLGLLAGVLGGLFSRGVIASRSFYQKYLPSRLPWQIGVAGLLSGLIAMALPVAFRDNAGLQDFLLAGDATWQLLAIAFLSRFLLVLLATGSSASGGLFAPAMVLGASLGYLMILLIQALFGLPGFPSQFVIPISSPATYALTGMGAFFSAVTKGPITAIVIVFEMTSDFNLVLPLMIGVVVAYGIAEQISSGSIYDKLLRLSGIDLKQGSAAKVSLEALTAADVMQQQVETLSATLGVEEARAIFARSHHRGFPVVHQRELVGILSQSDLANVPRHQVQIPIREFMTPQPVTVRPADTLAHVLYLLNHHQISRLPVTDGRKLVGIITRADIIRAESEKLSGGEQGLKAQPSYVVYQTRGPALGSGRLLVPLANPQTAPTLLQMAAAIARDRNYELECLQIMVVSKAQSPAETPVNVETSCALLQKAIALGQDWHVPVHTQVRVTHDVSQAILETIRERRIDLTLMGWKGKTQTPGYVFGNTMDALIRHASCELILVKLGDRLQKMGIYPSLFARLHLNRWLMALRPDGNAQEGSSCKEALALLPVLASIGSTPEIFLCQVTRPDEHQPNLQVLQESAEALQRQVDCPVATSSIAHNSVSDGILALAQQDHCDVIILGASQQSLLQQVIQGNISEAIARKSRSTVILVRTGSH